MNIIQQRPWILILIIITGLYKFENAIGQQKATWRVKNRLQVSYEFDDNIRETTSDTVNNIEDSSLKFLFHSRAFRTTPRTRITFTYRGGLQTYFQNSFENKLINEIEVHALLKFLKIALGFRGWGRLKIYLNDQFDYATGSAEVYFHLPSIFGFGNEFAFKSTGLNYQNFPSFDYSENQIRWSISKKIASHIMCQFEFSGKQVRYDRSAQSVIQSLSQGDFILLDFKQKDNNYSTLIRLGYTKSFLLNLSYSFHHNDSNSFGYSYNKHQLILIFGFPFPNYIWLRAYGALQIKDYTEDTMLMFPTDIDTERQESNFIVLDISKDINQNLSALLRLAYYSNESIIRSRFYQKTIIAIGFDVRL